MNAVERVVRNDAPWMQGYEGEMNRIMEEMWAEMMPLMMPGALPSPETKHKMMKQFRMKLSPGMEDGEIPGSLSQAMKHLMPEMQMDPSSMAPGESSKQMVQAMLRGWDEKYGSMPDVEPMPMSEGGAK